MTFLISILLIVSTLSLFSFAQSSCFASSSPFSSSNLPVNQPVYFGIPSGYELRPDERPNRWKIEALKLSRAKKFTVKFGLYRSTWNPWFNDLLHGFIPMDSSPIYCRISENVVLCHSNSTDAGFGIRVKHPQEL